MVTKQYKEMVRKRQSRETRDERKKIEGEPETGDFSTKLGQISRKMLTSHSSILNVLGNPELDINIPERYTRAPTPMIDFKDPTFSLSSWQDISSPNRPTSLVLSNTSDDDEMALMTTTGHRVMVFETDEEEVAVDSIEFEPCDIQQEDSPTFIMPQLTVSDGSENLLSNKFAITILSSKLTLEITKFVETLKSDLNYELIKINHYGLFEFNSSNNSKKKSRKTNLLINNSNLIFLINDGSKIFIDFLSNQENFNLFPKLTIINMMTVNYFVNLFEIINIIKPYQIWKTSSLSNNSILLKCKNFIDLEFSQIEQLKNQLSTVYSSLMVSSKKDYKSIERKFRLDLSQSNNYIDPLQISLKFSKFSWIYNIFKSSLSKSESDLSDQHFGSSKLWLVASFTLGIGLGVGITSGTATMLGCYLYQICELPQAKSSPVFACQRIDDWEHIDSFFNLPSYQHFLDYVKLKTSDLKCFLDVLLHYVKGGFDKFLGLILSIF